MSFRKLLKPLQKLIPLDSPIRVFYHYLRAVIARAWYGNPGKKMTVIGITGTKGKSTTTNIIARGLEAAGKKVFMFSTINYTIDGEWFENNMKMTSLDPFALNRLLKQAENAGCEYAVIETSSHALFYNRVYGIDYDTVVLTNISQDHLDLHKTMDNYIKTKLRLFTNLVEYERKPGIKKISIVNLDSYAAERFLEPTADIVSTYGKAGNAQIRAEDIVLSRSGTQFTIRMPSTSVRVKTVLRGLFNVENILAATATLVAQKVSMETIKETIEALEVIPGRLEEVPNSRDVSILVDYAHTEESLRSVLETIRSFSDTKRIITVFGATGDRDREKRPKMGKVVDTFSDIIILTEDDNYTEDPLRIITEVSKGIRRKEGEWFWVVFHREDAIRTALLAARPGDSVLIAGKGAETVMVTNEGNVPWSDREVVGRILDEMDQNILG